MVYIANLTCWTILYWFLQGRIQNTLIIAESDEGDMHQLRSLSRKVRCSANSAVGRSHNLKASELKYLAVHLRIYIYYYRNLFPDLTSHEIW